MHYPVLMKKDLEGEGVTVSFCDIPEAEYWADNNREAANEMFPAFLSSIQFRIDTNNPIALPSIPDLKLETILEIPINTAAKILFFNEFLKAEISRSDLAHRMGMHKQHVHRLFKIRYNCSTATLDKAMRALGKHFSMSVQEQPTGSGVQLSEVEVEAC